jgi:hypothetical protein
VAAPHTPTPEQEPQPQHWRQLLLVLSCKLQQVRPVSSVADVLGHLPLLLLLLMKQLLLLLLLFIWLSLKHSCCPCLCCSSCRQC